MLIPKYKKDNDTQTSEQSYPDIDHGIITPVYQSNYARSLKQMQTYNIESNILPIQN